MLIIVERWSLTCTEDLSVTAETGYRNPSAGF